MPRPYSKPFTAVSQSVGPLLGGVVSPTVQVGKPMRQERSHRPRRRAGQRRSWSATAKRKRERLGVHPQGSLGPSSLTPRIAANRRPHGNSRMPAHSSAIRKSRRVEATRAPRASGQTDTARSGHAAESASPGEDALPWPVCSVGSVRPTHRTVSGSVPGQGRSPGLQA